MSPLQKSVTRSTIEIKTRCGSNDKAQDNKSKEITQQQTLSKVANQTQNTLHK